MALTVFADSTTTTTTRETRSTSNMIKTTSSTGISSTSKVTKVSKNATMTKKTRPSTVKTPQPSRDNEKENINPLTGLEQGISKKVKAVFGGNAKGNVVDREEVMLKASNVKTTRPQTRSVTSPAREKIARDIPAPSGATATVPKRRTRKSDPKASTSTILDDVLRLPPLEDTLAGRLLSARRSETDADRRARELTVRPLADLSEAFNVGGSVRPREVESDMSTLLSETNAQKEHERDQVAPEDLTAALHLLIASDETARLPSVVRTRGIKRSRARASDPTSLRSQQPSTSSTPAPRPMKRLRTAQSQPRSSLEFNIPSQTSFSFELEYPVVPPNSPVRSRASTLPSIVNIPSVHSNEPSSDPIPSLIKYDGNSDEEEGESWMENTQGSSHFSGLGLGLGMRGRNSFERSRDSFDFGSQL